MASIQHDETKVKAAIRAFANAVLDRGPELARAEAEADDEGDPEDWDPKWDNWFWTAEPCPEDADWWSRESNSGSGDGLDEDAAAESAALDAIERSLIPRDLAE